MSSFVYPGRLRTHGRSRVISEYNENKKFCILSFHQCQYIIFFVIGIYSGMFSVFLRIL